MNIDLPISPSDYIRMDSLPAGAPGRACAFGSFVSGFRSFRPNSMKMGLRGVVHIAGTMSTRWQRGGARRQPSRLTDQKARVAHEPLGGAVRLAPWVIKFALWPTPRITLGGIIRHVIRP